MLRRPEVEHVEQRAGVSTPSLGAVDSTVVVTGSDGVPPTLPRGVGETKS
jgi:hypothetical protein